MTTPPTPPFPGPPPPLPEPPGRPRVPPLPMPPILPTPFGTADEPRLTVRGEAVVEAEPELATVRVTVGARGRDRRATLDELGRRNNAVLDLLQRHTEAVERLDTSAFTVTPELADRRGEKVRAHRGRVLIRVTLTDFAALGELATRIADLDLTRVDGPWWSLRHDSPVHREARRRAVHEAVQRAREYAEALGAELRALLELADTDTAPAGRGGGPELAAFAHRSAAGAEETVPLRLEPEIQTVSAQVTAQFTITRPDLGPRRA
ncbi:hypothetical protein GCM10027168_46850 [Streptomyces capparidis]